MDFLVCSKARAPFCRCGLHRASMCLATPVGRNDSHLVLKIMLVVDTGLEKRRHHSSAAFSRQVITATFLSIVKILPAAEDCKCRSLRIRSPSEEAQQREGRK